MVQGDRGTQFTLNGNPGVVFSFVIESDGGDNTSFSGTLNGSVDWATPEKSGSCGITYGFSGQTSATGFSFSTEGTFCGQDVSQTLSFSG